MEKRNLNLDLIRLVAALAVILTHTSALVVSSNRAMTLDFWIGDFFDSLSRLGVILFVMVTGALMLDEEREMSLKKIYGKKVVHMIALTFFWALVYAGVYYVILPNLFGDAVSSESFVYHFFKGHYHMWYLYMLIGLYLVTPFLRAFAKKDKPELVLLFILLADFSQFLKSIIKAVRLVWPNANYALMVLDQLSLDFFAGFTACYLLGWYLVHVGLKTQQARVGLFVTGAVALLVTFLYVGITGDYKNGYSNFNILIFIYAASAFELLHALPLALSEGLERWLVSLSNLSFGVYIVHPMVLSFVMTFIVTDLGALTSIVMWTILVTLLSFALTFVLSKTFFVRKTMRM